MGGTRRLIVPCSGRWCLACQGHMAILYIPLDLFVSIAWLSFVERVRRCSYRPGGSMLCHASAASVSPPPPPRRPVSRNGPDRDDEQVCLSARSRGHHVGAVTTNFLMTRWGSQSFALFGWSTWFGGCCIPRYPDINRAVDQTWKEKVLGIPLDI